MEKRQLSEKTQAKLFNVYMGNLNARWVLPTGGGMAVIAVIVAVLATVGILQWMG